MLFGVGDGTLGRPQVILGGISPTKVAIGYFDGNGVPDIATTLGFPADVLVLTGVGNGTFNSPQTFVTPGASLDAIDIDDLNGDGFEDLVVTNRQFTLPGDPTPDYVFVLLGMGNGSFGPAQALQSPTVPAAVEIADLNGDGALDLSVGAGETFQVSVLLGMGDGTFEPATTYFADGFVPSGVRSADFDGDGAIDLVVANSSSSTVAILLNQLLN